MTSFSPLQTFDLCTSDIYGGPEGHSKVNPSLSQFGSLKLSLASSLSQVGSLKLALASWFFEVVSRKFPLASWLFEVALASWFFEVVSRNFPLASWLFTSWFFEVVCIKLPLASCLRLSVARCPSQVNLEVVSCKLPCCLSIAYSYTVAS